ncbi:MAG TPA: hypothetical protein VFF27_05540 [Bacteroidia bacterium]|jgi:hypothetical protein|nr:hypothetical protein [Bacteroidia bacterium]
MKKIILLACGLCFTYAVNATQSSAHAEASAGKESIVAVAAADWVKTSNGTWEGARGGKKLFYKINATDGSLWASADNQKWETVKEGTWEDKNGKLLKLDGKALKSSTDGTNWALVIDSQWEGSNGIWYKFDEELILWFKSEKI